MVAALHKRIGELEKENALMMRALTKLTEQRTEEVREDTPSDDYWIPGTIPEPETSGN